MISYRSIALAMLLFTAAVSAHTEESKKQHMSDKRTCAKILRISGEHLEQLMRSDYQENHDTYCFVRCIAILEEKYDDEQGLLIDDMFEMHNLGMTKEQFTEKMRACQEENGDENIECHCRKAFKPVMCFRKHYHEWRNTQTEGN